MNAIKATLLATLVAASSLALADEPVTSTTRDQRMDQALQDYRQNNGTSAGGMRRGDDGMRHGDRAMKHGDRMTHDTAGEGPAARAEDSIKNGARKTGHAIGNAARKTGHAIHRGADKLTGKTPDPQ